MNLLQASIALTTFLSLFCPSEVLSQSVNLDVFIGENNSTSSNVDLSSIDFPDRTENVIRLINDSDRLVRSVTIKSSCPCVVVENLMIPIPPGASAEIPMTFNFAGRYGQVGISLAFEINENRKRYVHRTLEFDLDGKSSVFDAQYAIRNILYRDADSGNFHGRLYLENKGFSGLGVSPIQVEIEDSLGNSLTAIFDNKQMQLRGYADVILAPLDETSDLEFTSLMLPFAMTGDSFEGNVFRQIPIYLSWSRLASEDDASWRILNLSRSRTELIPPKVYVIDDRPTNSRSLGFHQFRSSDSGYNRIATNNLARDRRELLPLIFGESDGVNWTYHSPLDVSRNSIVLIYDRAKGFSYPVFIDGVANSGILNIDLRDKELVEHFIPDDFEFPSGASKYFVDRTFPSDGTTKLWSDGQPIGHLFKYTSVLPFSNRQLSTEVQKFSSEYFGVTLTSEEGVWEESVYKPFVFQQLPRKDRKQE